MNPNENNNPAPSTPPADQPAPPAPDAGATPPADPAGGATPPAAGGEAPKSKKGMLIVLLVVVVGLAAGAYFLL